jgi:hypothetical protein
VLRTELSGVAVILLLAAACNEPIREFRKIKHEVIGGPQVLATVVTIRTTFQPANRTTSSGIVIGDDAARATAEIGTWRLFDFRHDRVAFVDDYDKTYRYETIRSLVERRRDAADDAFIDKIPLAEFSKTGATRAILGLNATQSVVRLGAYQRELWFASHPQIPPGLFALMHASETPSADAPMAKKVDEGLLAARGFPLLDHSELPFANRRIVIDRSVVSVERRNVPETLLQIPAGYREVKPVQPVRVARPSAPPPTTTATTATMATTATTATVAPPSTETTATTARPPEKPKPVLQKKVPAKKTAPVTKKPATTKKPTTKKLTMKKAKAPASHPPASSSPPHDQKTPKGGSRSSGKVQKTP